MYTTKQIIVIHFTKRCNSPLVLLLEVNVNTTDEGSNETITLTGSALAKLTDEAPVPIIVGGESLNFSIASTSFTEDTCEFMFQ